MVGSFDVVILGAGAAGLFCAARSGQAGLRVLLIDHAENVAEKIRISGGGRCNFTNLDTTPRHFHSANPAFCKSALARFTPSAFVELVRRHGIPFHEKHRGQLFCDESAERIIDMLLAECAAGHVQRWQPCAVQAVQHREGQFEVATTRGPVSAPRLVVATGGLSIPKIGASGFGHQLARQFGHAIVPTRPALVPLTFETTDWAPFAALAGISLEVAIEAGPGKPRTRFVEDLLFTHRGLSGPAVLQASSLWEPGDSLHIDLLPGFDVAPALLEAKASSRRHLSNVLAQWLPQRLGDAWLTLQGLPPSRPIADTKDADLRSLGRALAHWQVSPNGTEGFRKAEATAGGVDTRELDSRSMQSRRIPGLFFIGEVVDVLGWLGGFNFQWAWASAAACADAIASSPPPHAPG